MSLGYSANDFIHLANFAYTVYRNSKEAGAEYVEISREVKTLHGVLKALRNEANRDESTVFKHDTRLVAELSTAADGCTRVLKDIDNMLGAYQGLKPDHGAVSKSKQAWHRFRFGFKMDNLSTIRSKLITYTSTISVLLDTMQLRATGRVECKIDDGFAKVMGSFDHMRKAIYDIAVRGRATADTSSVFSLSSLSTYTGDEKEVWRQFRRELLAKGFRSHALDKHRHVLQAYMLRLHESGILEADQPPRLERVTETSRWASHECLDPLHFQPMTQCLPHPRRRSDAGASRYTAVDSQKPTPRAIVNPLSKQRHEHQQQDPWTETAIGRYKEQAMPEDKDLANTLLALRGCVEGQREFFDRLSSQSSRTHPAPRPEASSPPSRHSSPQSCPVQPTTDPSTELQPTPSLIEAATPIAADPEPQKNTQICNLTPALKSILKSPTPQFPEPQTLHREGVAPSLTAALTIPPTARWTKVSTKHICPTVLASCRERYEARADRVIILRVLSAEEVRWYAAMTEWVRGMFGSLLPMT